MDIENEAPKGNLSTKIIFILFGVASLLGWNALLTELDFFDFFLHSMNPYVSFSFLNYILNIAFLCLLMIKKDLFPLKFQLIGGIVGSIAFLILIPAFTIILEKDSFANRFITGTLVVLMGFINALCSGGFFNLVSYFPLEMIVSLSAGQGFSGIAMNVLQYIVLLSINSNNMKDENEKKRIYTIRGWVFFSISSLILLLCLILLLLNYNSPYFQYYLKKSKESSEDEATKGLIEGEENTDNIVESNELQTEKTQFSFKEIFLKIWDLNLLMAYIYIITFTLFPNASIIQDLFNLKTDYLNYNSNTIILIYNVFDTIGRYLVAKVKPTKRLNLIIILGRSILLFTLVFNYCCQVTFKFNINITSIFLILNVATLAATNGIGTTLCFGIAPNEVEDEYKGQVGTSLSFFLIVGIFLGACIAFGTDAIMNSFPKK
jgi:equilibrative nucleoside transporter 1/2/3